MLKFDLQNHKLEKLQETDLKSEKVLERYDLQKTIVTSWDLFKNELGYPSAILIGQEINPHPSTQDSIDLLAFDLEDSSIIVIELKRDRNKLQLLQSLSYAAMVSKWTSDDIKNNIQKDISSESEELIDFVDSNDISTTIKTVLVSENYDPEVILTADWLSGTYGVDISAFSISMHKSNNSHYISVEQRYPLKVLDDVYDKRGQRKHRASPKLQLDWADVIPKLKYSFAERGVNLCRKIMAGEPSRRRFGGIRNRYDRFSRITIGFRAKYVNVYVAGKFDGAEEHLQSKFSDDITISTWKGGHSLIIETEQQFNDLVKWLKLD